MSSVPKSILKRRQDDASVDGNQRIIWDEDNLQKNEDEKVPRMKIDEPKTPFHHASFSPNSSPQIVSMNDGVMLPNFALQQQKEHVSTETSLIPTICESSESEDFEEEDPYFGMSAGEILAEKAKHDKFSALRKQHYNMKSAMMHAVLTDDESEEEEEDQSEEDK